MITVKTNQVTTVKLNLNPNKLDSASNVDVVFTSPSRPLITLNKSLNTIRSGFYSFDITLLDASSFIDDSYSYEIQQNGSVLKCGKVWVTTVEFENLVFDYVLDFTIS